jgi:hypothetical protein
MDPRIFLRLAENLVGSVKQSAMVPGTSGESECRTAISRAYYASFLVAVDFLDAIGVVVTTSGQCHVAVQYAMNNSGHSNLIRVAATLGTLYSERRAADYELRNRRAERVAQAEASIQMAQAAIALLDQITSGTSASPFNPQAVAAAILGWASNAQFRGVWKK